MQKITDIALSGRAPKTVWGVIAAACFWFDSNPDQLEWVPVEAKPIVSMVVKLGTALGLFFIGAATPRPDFLKKKEERDARAVLNDSAQPKNPIPKPAVKRPTKKKIARKTATKKKAAKKYTKKKL